MTSHRIDHWFFDTALLHGALPAVVSPTETLSYAQLASRANQLAHQLREAGARPNHFVGFLLSDRIDWITAILGCLRAGCIFVPLDPSYPRERLAHMLQAARPRFLVHDARQQAQALGLVGVGPVRPLLFPERWPAELLAFEPPALRDDGACYVYFTSGSTGKPKAILGRHRSVRHFIAWEIEAFQLGTHTRISQLTSPSFDAFLRDVFAPLCCGGSLHIPPPDTLGDGARLLAWLDGAQITQVHCVPSVFRTLLAHHPQSDQLQQLTHVLMAGEPLLPADVDRWMTALGERVQLVNLYGPSETTMVRFCYRVQSSDRKAKSLSVGQPIPGARAFLLDAHGQPCAPGAIGRMHIATAYASYGYLAMPRLTAAAFTPVADEADALLYDTGDLARLLPDGNYQLMGRVDRQVKIRGVRVELEEIENILRRHPKIHDAALLACQDGSGSTYLAACLVAPECAKEEPRAYLSRHLPANMVPGRFVFMPSLPHLPNGKLDHASLTRSLEAMPTNETGTNVFPEIAAIFAQVLGHRDVGPHENFFHLGGHSLLATQVVARLLGRFGKLVPLAAFFDHPTVAGIGAFMESLPEYREAPSEKRKQGPDDAWAPLSPAQRGVWFIDQLEGPSSAYNIYMSLALQGPLCPRSMNAALDYVVRRHGALRTYLPTVAGEPRQVVNPPAPVMLNFVDLSQQRDLLPQVASRVGRQPFKLDRCPLWRALAVRLDGHSHVLCLTLHHIISDGWSMNIFRRDLFTAYRAFAQKKAPVLPPLRTDFLAYARDRFERESSGQLKQQLEWWTALLDGAPQLLQLPYAKPRPTHPNYRGDRFNFEIDLATGARLNALASERGVTPYMILLANFAVLLARESGKRDLVIGTPIANRTRAELEPLIGFFVNTLAPRINLSGNPSFTILLERVRKLTLEAYNYQDVPFEKIVETVNPTRHRNVNPVFQVMFILQNVPRSASAASELKVTPQDMGSITGRTKFDLTLSMSQTGDAFKGSLRYAVECFDAEDMTRFGHAFGALLTEVCSKPDKPLFDEDLRTRELVLIGDPAPYHQPVQDLFQRIARQLPEQIAIETPWSRCTYAELAQHACGLAQFLRERGLRKGDVIAVFSEDAASLASAMLAVLEIGACFMPLLNETSAPKLSQLLGQAPPRWALVDANLTGELELPCPWSTLSLDVLPAAASYQPVVSDPDAAVSIFFTSGSTGVPKAVSGRACSVDHYVHWAIETFAFASGTRFSQWAPFNKDDVLRDIFLPLCLGGTLVQVHRDILLSPPALIDWVASQEIEIVHCVPSLLRPLLAEGLEREVWPKLRALFLYGEPVFPQDPERWFNAFAKDVLLVNLYGATETTLAKTFHCFGPRDKDHTRMPAGKPLPGIELCCVDENDEPADSGEVLITGPYISLGYLNGRDPHAFARDLKGRPFFRTGDLGRIDEQGRLVLLGRKDRQVKIRGVRVALDEIEALLLKDILVEEVCVQMRQDGDGNGYLCAFLVGSFPSDYDPAARLSKSLPAPAIPSVFAVLPQLPRLVCGKVDHKKLAHQQIRRGDLLGLATGTATNSDHVAELMRTIWAGVLHLEDVDFSDDFFRLGGHSLLATVVVNRVREALGVQLSLGAIFEQPTLAGQIKLVDNLLREGERASAYSTPILPDTADNQLSSAQQRLWVLQQLTPGLTAYNMSLLLNFTAPFSVVALERAMVELVTRHKILRTTFPAEHGRPISQIQERWRKILEIADLSALGLKPDHLRRMGLRQVQRPFNLEREIPIRATLLRLENGRHMLLLCLHHIAADEVSLTIIKKELREMLQPLLRNHAPSLPPLPVQYNDFASWQRKISSRDLLHVSEDFWREKLLGAPPLLDLPLEKPRPRERSYRGAQLSFSLDEQTSRVWMALCRDNRVTLFMGLLASFKVLLAHYCRNRDIVVGSTVSLRDSQKLEPLVGLFINTLVLRSDLSGAPSFRDVLARIRQVVLETHQHRHTPFEHLVEALKVERNPSYNPLFQVMFIYREDHGTRSAATRSIAVRQTTSKFDLTLTARKGARGFKFLFTFDRDLFSSSAIKAMRGHLLQLLRVLPEHLDRNVFQVAMCSERERERQLHTWNDTSLYTPGTRLLHHLIEERAAREPERIALVHQEQSFSYTQLLELARGIEARLRRLGIGPEQHVAVCMARCPEMVAALIGIHMRGAAYLPMDPSYPSARLRYMLEDAAAVLVLGKSGAASDLADLTPVLDLDQFDLARAVENYPSFQGSDEHAAYVQYTSGSTGKPKGVVIPHRGPVAFVNWAAGLYTQEDLTGVLAGTSICFDLSVFELFTTLALGGRIILADSLLDIVRLPAFNEVSLINSVPSAVHSLFAEGHIPRGLRVVNLAGEAFNRALVDMVYRHPSVLRVFNLYGPTEDTTYSTGALLTRNGQLHPPIGRSLTHKRMYVLDDFLKLVPVGVPGQVFLAGAGLARGYHHQPALTASRFLPDPFDRLGGGRIYRTGDLARWQPSSSQGTAVYLGRIDAQVKLRGYRIELGEIESCLEAHLAVVRSAVLALQGQRRTALIAFVQLLPGAPELDLAAHVARNLPVYMVPAQFKILELPLTPNGKIDRKELANLVLEDKPEAAQSVPARNEAERTLVAIWQAVLGRENVGVFDNFFELGGDSIMGIQVIARAARAGLHLSAGDFLHHQNIAAQAAAAATAATIDAEQGPVTGLVLPLPISSWLFEKSGQIPNFFNQSRFYNVKAEMSAKALERALNGVLDHHDVMRSRVSPGAPLKIRQLARHFRLKLQVIDASAMGASESELFKQVAARYQISLDLSRGPVLRACLLRRAHGPSLLLITVHHLLVDGVSWRILAADLERACQACINGKPVNLGAKTTSLKAWSQRLRRKLGKAWMTRESSYWKAMAHGRPTLCPRDFAGEHFGTYAENETMNFGLTARETRALLQEVPRAFQCSTNEALLAALARTLSSWCNQDELIINTEGHGREPLFPDVDLSRTVGWFTSLYPIKLVTSREENPARLLKSIKEQVRSLPHKGIGFGMCRYLSKDAEVRATLAALDRVPVCFNYLGRTDEVRGENKLIWRANPSAGLQRDPAMERHHLLDLNAYVRNGKFCLRIAYSRSCHRAKTIRALGKRFIHNLRAITNQSALDARTWTPADFPLARLSGPALSELLEKRLSPGQKPRLADVLPFLPLQRGMLYHALLSPTGGFYHEQWTCTLKGSLDSKAFEGAWHQVFAQHEALRCIYFWQGLAQPLQLVLDQPQLLFRLIDLSHLDAREQELAFKQCLKADRREGFTVEGRLPHRFVLFRLSANLHRFVWSYHHMVCDGWSLALVRREVFQIFEKLKRGETLKPRSAPKLHDYLSWFAANDRELGKDYWQRALAGFREPTPLPGWPAAEGRPSHFRELKLSLPMGLSRDLEALARRWRVTLNTLVQGMWALLLQTYGGKNDLVFGFTAAIRPAHLPAIESMVGLCINTLPARLVLDPEQRLDQWLSQCLVQLTEARGFGYSDLADIVSWSEVVGNKPLFESIVVYENYPRSPRSGKARNHTRVQNTRILERGNYPLALIARLKGSLNLRFIYDAGCVPEELARLLPGQAQAVFQSMVDQPEGRLKQVNLLSPEERQQLLVAVNETQVALAGTKLLPQRIAELAVLEPESLALVEGEQSLTYRALQQQVEQLAQALLARGIRPEDHIGVQAPANLTLIVAFLGILRSGGVYVPLNPAFPAKRRALLIEDAGCKLVIGGESDELAGVPFASLSALLAEPGRNLPLPTLLGEQSAYLLYTSGSTGVPKGVLVRHTGLAALAQSQMALFASNPQTRVLMLASPSFDASIWEIVMALYPGGRLYLVNQATGMLGLELAHVLGQNRITHLTITPAALGSLPPRDLPFLDCLVVAGDACPTNLVPFWSKGRRFFNAYGPTETTVCASAGLCRRGVQTPPIGRAIPNMALHVLDAHLRPLPLGCLGEIFIGGVGLARGYHRRPAQTAQVFVPNPFAQTPGERLYRSGDLARWVSAADDALPVLVFAGRRDQQVKLRGKRIELGEIESTLGAIPGVQQAAVFLCGDHSDDHKLVAFLAIPEQSEPQSEEIKAYLQAHLPDYMVPSALEFVAEMPLTPHGKIDRAVLRGRAALVFQKPLPFPSHVAPASEQERKIAEVWGKVLHLKKVSVTRTFSDMGGNSLLLLKLHGALSAALGPVLSLADLFNLPTVRSLAQFCNARANEGVEAEAELGAQERASLMRQREAARRRPARSKS